MLRIFALLFGVAFIVGGIAGYGPPFMVAYVPNLMKDGLLLGYFQVDSMHNMVHIASGIVFVLAAMNYTLSKLFFILFGIVYTAVGILGFWREGDLFIMHVNLADNNLHLAIGIICMFFGFGSRRAS